MAQEQEQAPVQAQSQGQAEAQAQPMQAPAQPREPQPEPTPEAGKKEEILEDEMTTLHERTIAMLSYVGPLAIVPFYLKKESKFCRFHGKQGMVLVIIFFVAKIIGVLDFTFDLFSILQVGLFFYMGYQAISGKWKKLPLVYDWACKLEKTLTLKTKEEELAEMENSVQ